VKKLKKLKKFYKSATARAFFAWAAARYLTPVSYTHLDVYKRQTIDAAFSKFSLI